MSVAQYPVHTLDSAPDKSKPALNGLKQSFGMVPNLAATMASSPTLINGFVGAFGNFHGGSFSAAERQVLLLTNAVANRSPWAVAFHSTLALKEGVAAGDVQAIRQARVPPDQKLAALVEFDRALIEQRGAVSEQQLASLRQAGYASEQVLEILAGLAVSVMANYAGNITRPPLEAAFEAQAWQG